MLYSCTYIYFLDQAFSIAVVSLKLKSLNRSMDDIIKSIDNDSAIIENSKKNYIKTFIIIYCCSVITLKFSVQ